MTEAERGNEKMSGCRSGSWATVAGHVWWIPPKDGSAQHCLTVNPSRAQFAIGSRLHSTSQDFQSSVVILSKIIVKF